MELDCLFGQISKTIASMSSRTSDRAWFLSNFEKKRIIDGVLGGITHHTILDGVNMNFRYTDQSTLVRLYENGVKVGQWKFKAEKREQIRMQRDLEKEDEEHPF